MGKASVGKRAVNPKAVAAVEATRSGKRVET